MQPYLIKESENVSSSRVLCYFVNVDWYFGLHWKARAKAAIDDGWQVHLITGGGGDALDDIRKIGVKCHALPVKRSSVNPFDIMKTCLTLRRALKMIKPDILHCITTVANLSGGIVARMLRLPVVFSVPGTGWVFSSPTVKARLVRHLVIIGYRWISNNRKSIFIFENYDDEIMFRKCRMLGAARSEVILGAGVDTDLYSPFKVDPAGSVLRFMFAARLLKSKGLPYLVQAGKQLHAAGYTFEILICGLDDHESPDAIEASQISTWQAFPFVKWLGPQREMQSVLQQADVVVLPTLYGEGVPRILIEAASCGLAVIATDMPGCREVVRHQQNGILVEAGDVNSLARAMLAFIENPELCRCYGDAGRQLILSEFDQIYVNSATVGLYRELFENKIQVN
jgi:glycosyltransferase involved in cell wall biosynthesis